MPRIYNRDDRLPEFLDYLDRGADPCQEAKDYCRALGDISMGEWVAHIQNNDLWMPDWTAYAVIFFPNLIDQFLMSQFKRAMNADPKALSVYTSNIDRKRGKVELEDNG